MKMNLYVCALSISVLVSCSDTDTKKSEIKQYPIVLDEVSEKSVTVASRSPNVHIAVQESQPLSPQLVLLSKEVEPAPPPPPEPEPEPEWEILLPPETMEEKWQRIVQGAVGTGRYAWENARFCQTYGDTLVEQGRYQEAIVAYEKAIEIDYPYKGDCYWKIARVYGLQGKDVYEIDNYLLKRKRKYSLLKQTKELKNYEFLLQDTAFQAYRKWERFWNSYDQLFKGNKLAMFEAFKYSAPEAHTVGTYDLGPTNLFEAVNAKYDDYQLYEKEHPIVYGYFDAFVKEARYRAFSRSGRNLCRFEMCMAQENYFLVVYSVEESWSEYILPKKYYLVTYNKQGDKISELEVAKRGSLKTCKAFVLNADNSFVVTNYAIKWKKGAKQQWRNKNFYNQTHLKKTIAKSSQAYEITISGRVIEAGGSISMR
ncbi:tetratricopeptide repeat protein [Aureispira sp. CCB-E]|uniref:tetratricopeptide repeat protein n=1 Tax=Aureispira sp. CCB-E TaxID=3051121 RepID=UPI00286930CF|nr:tetratricopeptide repeat protein [Aureispira sp. CCB-E]WMX12558.1 tetratricopeptide repeat protein [Aureispira sp. CCB-E]